MPRSKSPYVLTQIRDFQLSVAILLIGTMALWEGFEHWQVVIFFAVLILSGLVLREIIWGHQDLMDDYLEKDLLQNSLWLFVFGRKVKSHEYEGLERKRLLRVSSPGRKMIVRSIMVVATIVYALWMKKSPAAEFRPSASLYIVGFSLLISTVFLCQFWTLLGLSVLVAIFSMSQGLSHYPEVYGLFLGGLFVAMSLYRFSGFQWVYANENNFRKKPKSLKLWNSVGTLIILAFFSLWIFDQMLPHSTESIRDKWVKRAVQGIKEKLVAKVAQRMTADENGFAINSQMDDIKLNAPKALRQELSSEISSPTSRNFQAESQQKTLMESQKKPQAESRSIAQDTSTSRAETLPSSEASPRVTGSASSENDPRSLQSSETVKMENEFRQFEAKVRQDPFLLEKIKSESPVLEKEGNAFEKGHPPGSHFQKRLREEFALEKKLLANNSSALPQGKEASNQEFSQDASIGSKRFKGEGLNSKGEHLQKMDREAIQEAHPSVSSANPEKRRQEARLQVEKILSLLATGAKVLGYLSLLYFVYLLYSRLTARRSTAQFRANAVGKSERLSLMEEVRQLRSPSVSGTEEVILSYQLFLRLMELIQFPRSQHQGPSEFALSVGKTFPKLQASVDVLTQLFCRVLYGNEEIENSLLADFRERLNQILKQFHIVVPR